VTRIYQNLSDWRSARGGADYRDRSVGFVPTMGALHAGHMALIGRARAENDRVVLSIFVNPTQFDNAGDLSRYPRTLEQDLAMVGDRVDAILAPGEGELYPDNFRYRVAEHDLSRRWEGARRPGHFEGVLTVVLKLLNLVQADRAYFGEKDWQQLQLVTGMARAFFLKTEIVACPTVRDTDGLALSSRNVLLSPPARRLAGRFPDILRSAPDSRTAVADLERAGIAVDYVEESDGVRLGAVRVEGVRLIDNVRR
jgi:pantoate--beta-alanine ligase